MRIIKEHKHRKNDFVIRLLETKNEYIVYYYNLDFGASYTDGYTPFIRRYTDSSKAFADYNEMVATYY